MKGGAKMKISPPKKITWWIALILGVIGLVANLVTIPVLSGLAFWLALVGLVLLLLANVLPGL
jgi:4-hydroxybenzoate polyprenyltransferase